MRRLLPYTFTTSSFRRQPHFFTFLHLSSPPFHTSKTWTLHRTPTHPSLFPIKTPLKPHPLSTTHLKRLGTPILFPRPDPASLSRSPPPPPHPDPPQSPNTVFDVDKSALYYKAHHNATAVPAKRRSATNNPNDGGKSMLGLMMQAPLMVSDLLASRQLPWGRDRVAAGRGRHPRYTYAEAWLRTGKLANALARFGFDPGGPDRDPAWNGYRHFEIYYAVSGSASLNPFHDQSNPTTRNPFSPDLLSSASLTDLVRTDAQGLLRGPDPFDWRLRSSGLYIGGQGFSPSRLVAVNADAFGLSALDACMPVVPFPRSCPALCGGMVGPSWSSRPHMDGPACTPIGGGSRHAAPLGSMVRQRAGWRLAGVIARPLLLLPAPRVQPGAYETIAPHNPQAQAHLGGGAPWRQQDAPFGVHEIVDRRDLPTMACLGNLKSASLDPPAIARHTPHADGWFNRHSPPSTHGFMHIVDQQGRDQVRREWISSIELENLAVAHPLRGRGDRPS